MGRLILITGGARSGKSRFAQKLAVTLSKNVMFVATAEALDADMEKRIAEHKRLRPEGWQTLEKTDGLGKSILENKGKSKVFLIDCITLLISNIFSKGCSDDQIDAELIEKLIAKELKDLISCIKKTDGIFIAVTNEVGFGIVPENRQARLYRDMLGNANQSLADFADEVYLLVAGLPLALK